MSNSASHPTGQRDLRWTALIVLTLINLLNYIDRNIFSALAPVIQRDLGFTDTQLGLLGSAFIFSYTLVAPVCGWWGDRGSRAKVMAAGVAVWSIATAFSGLSRGFASQLATRVAVGLGESVYSVIAPSSIADYFSKRSHGRVFAVYSGAITVGSALGYILGEQLEKILGWQKTFFVVGLPGLVCAAVLLFLRDPERGAKEAPVATEDGITHEALPGGRNPWASFFATCGGLAKNGGFMCTVLGYAAYTFVVGGLSFWMPIYINRYFNVNNGISIFGAVTVVGGIVGTLIGGWWADKIERRSGNGFLKVCVWSILLAVPLFVLMLNMQDFQAFMIALFFMEVALFLCISPLDAAVINSVWPNMRATAMALNIFLIHALGDGISRALIGSISDHSGLRAAMAFCPWVLVLAGAIWLIGLISYWQPLHWPSGSVKIPAFQAHRGLWKPTRLQENTLEAFRAARASGAEMVEMDVQLSKDGRVIVFHDADLKRLGAREARVRECTAAELKQWVNAPTLEEVIRDKDVTLGLNVEIKSDSFGDNGLEREIARVVEATHAHGRIVFSSFNPFALRRIAKLLPEVPRALLVSGEKDKRNPLYLRKMWLGFYARPHLLHLGQEMISESTMLGWRERRIPVVVWTVNDPERARTLLGWKVRSVISDEILDIRSRSRV